MRRDLVGGDSNNSLYDRFGHMLSKRKALAKEILPKIRANRSKDDPLRLTRFAAEEPKSA